MKQRDCFEELVINGRNIKMAVKQAEWVVVAWMYLSQNKDQWWAVLNVVMILCPVDSAPSNWLDG
jgi:Gpi18-like mannosyltransferase